MNDTLQNKATFLCSSRCTAEYSNIHSENLRSVALYTVYTVTKKNTFENDKSMENMADRDTRFNILTL